MRVIWTGQQLKEKFEGCAFMQQCKQQAIYAILMNKQMNCKNQGRTNYVGHGKRQKCNQVRSLKIISIHHHNLTNLCTSDK